MGQEVALCKKCHGELSEQIVGNYKAMEKFAEGAAEGMAQRSLPLDELLPRGPVMWGQGPTRPDPSQSQDRTEGTMMKQ